MIYVTGDCHGNFRRFQSEYFPEQAIGIDQNAGVAVFFSRRTGGFLLYW